MIEAADEEFLSVVVKEEQKNLEVLLLCVQHQQRDQRLSSDNLFDKLWLGCPVNIVEGGDGVLLYGLFKQPEHILPVDVLVPKIEVPERVGISVGDDVNFLPQVSCCRRYQVLCGGQCQGYGGRSTYRTQDAIPAHPPDMPLQATAELVQSNTRHEIKVSSVVECGLAHPPLISDAFHVAVPAVVRRSSANEHPRIGSLVLVQLEAVVVVVELVVLLGGKHQPTCRFLSLGMRKGKKADFVVDSGVLSLSSLMGTYSPSVSLSSTR